MAKYKIQDTITGKTVTIESDQPPAENEMEGIFNDAGLREQKSIGGLAGNAVSDIVSMLEGVKNLPAVGAKLQEQYGSPTQLMFKDPVQYAKIMTSPIVGQAKQMASYTPLQELATGEPIQQYPERVANKIYEKPVTAALDAASLVQLFNMLKPSVATSVATNVPSKASNIAQSSGKQTYAGIFNVGKYKATRDLNPIKTSEELLKYDVVPNSLDDLAAKSNIVTGANGIINKAKIEAIGQAGDVSIDVAPAIKAMRESLLKVEGSNLKKVNNVITGKFQQLTPSKANPQKFNLLDAFELEKQLQSEAAKYRRELMFTGAVDTGHKAEAYSFAAQELGDQIDDIVKNIGVMDTLKTPERIQALSQVSPKVAKAFQEAKTISDWRAIEKTFVNAQKMVDETLRNMERPLNQAAVGSQARLAGAVAGGAVGNIPGAILGSIAGPAIQPVISGLMEMLKTPLATRAAKGLYNLPIEQITGGIGATKASIPMLLQALRISGKNNEQY